MQSNQFLTISEQVRADYRLADVFKKWNINYCCGGNQLLSEACRLQQLDQTAIEAELQQAQQTVLLSSAVSFDTWPVDFLTDYIVHVHHAYIKTIAPVLEQQLATFAEGHQKKYPCLKDVHEGLKKLIAMLQEQVGHEEDVIFPYVKQVNNAVKRNESYGQLFVRTLHKSLGETMEKAQRQTQSALTHLRQTAQHYRFAADACTNHQVLYHKLQAFDADAVQHKYLEQSILFPKVVQMEQELLQG